jgi:uncharacterized protein YndB with AHSA1/START domain
MSELTHEFTASFAAPRERVFRALTDETELTRWFAQHAQVDARPGGDFRFWGRHTCGAPVRAQATQRVLHLERPALLVFSWSLEGCDSEVRLALSGNAEAPGGATELQGRHHFPAAPSVPRPGDLVEDVWRSALANLRAHLAGGANIRLPDFSDPVPRVRQTILIGAPRDRVFQALLDPAILDDWLEAHAVVEPCVGGRYNYGWKYQVRGKEVAGGPTRILELVENTRLVTDWPDWRGDPDRPVQRVTWLLESVGERTRVVLVHDPFERTADLSDYPQGWAAILGRLKSRMETAASA